MHRAPIQLSATALCLLCAFVAGGVCAGEALAQAHGQVLGTSSVQAHGAAKRSHMTKRSRCARQQRRHAKHAKRCRSRHIPPKPAKPVVPASLTPATLLGVPAAAPPLVPPESLIASSPTPSTTPSEAPPSEAPAEVEPPSVAHVQVSAIEYGFSLSRTTVPAGKVIVQFVNDGQDEHNLKVSETEEGPVVGSFADTPSKGIGQLQLEMRSGSYTLFCSLQGHEAKGMKATLTVE
jgi:plastocyanin